MTLKNSEYLFSLTISDVHLGHPRTPTKLIIDNLIEQIFHDPRAREVDVIWVSGDLFDKLITVPDPNNFLIIYFISRLLYFCEKYDVGLRVLEGTGSHDYGQSKIIGEILAGSNRKVDYKYFDKVTIDYDERLDRHVLYVPDEVNHDSSITWHEVQKLLAEHNLEKVDYAIMHGFFEFQLPEHVHNPGAHLSFRYESIVKRHVLIGHHHTHRIEGKIIVPGSFDRLAHNEEGTKGHIRIKDYGTRSEVSFIGNPTAKIYKTIRLFDSTLEEALKRIDTQVLDTPPGSAYAIKAASTDPIAKAMDLVRSRHPQFVWTSVFEREDTKSQRIEEIELSYNPIKITNENLVSLLAPRLNPKCDPTTYDRAIRLLEAAL